MDSDLNSSNVADQSASFAGDDTLPEDGSVVTMVDVLEQAKEQEADANAVLGGADDKVCTYSQGYLPRQPLYACKTCSKDNLAGVCLGCSYNCHEGHELVELYTKRNFRCDCGNSNFLGAKCVLDPVKDEKNENNSYNQNFKGLYCTCNRPYPDDEDTVDDVMLQCIVCEDWYHGRHLKTSKENPEAEGEMICHTCVEKLGFLKNYVDLEAVEVAGECKIESLPKPKADDAAACPAEALFWPAGWRAGLCRCAKCMKIYAELKVEYLLDEKDSVAAYEARNQEKVSETEHEREMRALSSLDRVQQIEAITSYNEMKTALMEHLKQFKDNKRVVSESDIHEFFNEFKAKKRRVLVTPTCH